MDVQWVLMLVLIGLISAISGAISAYVTTRFVRATERRRLIDLETEVEALDGKLSRRTQRENSEKAQNKLKETSSIEEEALQRVNSRLESSTPSAKHTPGLHQGFYRR